ncbi:MAG: hypothetical protein FJX47_01370, partial [Alphaproteobacteria bacterium]|nr:hypothetical protein [Alphaproteobacteria bacterium]
AQAVKVKVLGVDERGKVRLSMRVVDQESGADITEQVEAEAKARAAERDKRRAEKPAEGQQPPQG